MKTLVIALALATSIAPAFASDVGVSISIGQPGFYGQIDIGHVPSPRLIYPEPVIIDRVRVVEQPIYLHIPPGHEKHWDKHCREYNACGRPVYFVHDEWYQREYVPRYRDEHREWHDDRRDRYDEGDQGEGHGHGHGHGNGHKHDQDD